MKVLPPPNNPETEREIIRLCLTDKTIIPQIASQITANDFYNPHNKQNYLVLMKSYQKDGIVDYREIVGISAYLAEDFVQTEVSPYWAKKLCNELRDLSQKRAVRFMASMVEKNLDKKSGKELIHSSLGALSLISEMVDMVKTDGESVIKELFQGWEETKGKTIVGISCGFDEIDGLIGGFRPGHIWLVGGYTNYGKTTLAISFLAHLIKNSGKSLLFCSTEMSRTQIADKILSNFTRQTSEWNRGHFEEPLVREMADKISAAKIEITDTLNSVESIVLKVQEMIIRGRKPEVVFIDFIQNIQGKGQSEYDRITTAIVELQAFARRAQICIVVLSQVNNQSVATSEVMGFKSSGALASAGDITIQVVRNKKAEVEAAIDKTATDFVEMKLIVQKNRHGRCGGFALDFDVTKGLIVNH